MKAISLFSGMGGDSLGIINSGLELVAYSEINKIFQKTHNMNFKNCELIGDGNILKTHDSDFLKYKNKIDLIFAGFPCQGFSNAGKKMPDDPRNSLFKEFLRATSLIEPNYIIGENVKGLLTKYTITNETLNKFLNNFDEKFSFKKYFPEIDKSKSETIKKIIDIIEGDNYDLNKLTKLFLIIKKEYEIENKNYLKNKKKIESNKKGKKLKLSKPKIIIVYEKLSNIYNEIKISYIDIIKSEFENIGYKIYYKVMKCNLHGIPQNRERLLIVGIKNTINKKFIFPEERENNTNLKQIVRFSMEGAIKIEKEDFDMNTIPPECILTDLSNDENEGNYHPNLKLLSKDKDFNYKNVIYPRRIHFGKRIPVGGEIIDIRKPLNTIICSYARIPRFFVPLKNKNGYFLRCLLPDELKQIQGFPKDYKIHGDRSNQIIQIGNAVPPPLITQLIDLFKD